MNKLERLNLEKERLESQKVLVDAYKELRSVDLEIKSATAALFVILENCTDKAAKSVAKKALKEMGRLP